jgi:membrane protease YdiL (CAAX protease family)
MSWPAPPPSQPPAPTGRPVVPHPHPEPRSYPLMLRTWNYAWWKPLVGIVVLGFGVVVLAPLVMIPVLAVAVRIEDNGPFLQAFEDAVSLKSVTPSAMLYLNLSLGSAVLVTWAIMRWVHQLRPRWLASVKPGLRWKFFAACLGLAVVALVAQVVVSAFLPQDPNDIGGGLNEITPKLVALAVVILLTTPLQAMGEEYAFRGYLMQAFGSLTKQPWVAIVLTSVLFALAHGVQNVPLFLDRFVFGLMAGFIVWRTGGLEAGIAMHVWNNIVAFGFALAFTDIDSALKVSEVSWWQIPLTLTQNGVYLVLVLLVARKMGIRNHTDPPTGPRGDDAVLVQQSPVV